MCTVKLWMTHEVIYKLKIEVKAGQSLLVDAVFVLLKDFVLQ